ncbi:hypothetical protein NA56DRAFT_652743 [Hyaloscypha hepaticicola]|uniref:REJ domain-containing protein n=1 Tax=Hyaloscypha hepaticicola TaxID=2082293 RepID=A0A2J6PDG4_9HELO|nr:hypothetical protein NA56DRAFT_652743 [Hyaloscypha hepaticicola]
MHLYRSAPALFALSSLSSLGSSLPFNFLDPLARRATYSVVPVDGGSAATTAASGGDVTIYITENPAPKTIIETDTVAVTEYLVSTKTIQLSGTVQTVLVTITPPAATVTTTGYSIIDVTPAQVTITATPSPSSSSVSTITSFTESSSTVTSTSSTSSSAVVTTAPSTNSTSKLLTIPSPSPSSSLSTSSHTYDNGQWHTYYPAWNASSTAIPSQVGATASGAATPRRLPTKFSLV